MVELAIVGEPHWELCDLELRRPGISYTVDTLRELRKIYPSAEFFFIAGSDSFQELKSWKEPEEILRLAEWIVAPRPSFDFPQNLPPRFHRLKIAPIEVSASELREKIGHGGDVSDWLPEKVLDYMARMNLYRTDKK
jgi:nicotinate-nucleotide adenylyltransferase